MKHEIKNRYTGSTLFTYELQEGQESGMIVRHAIEAAIASDADLRDANLCGANLCGADLRGADLRGADLRSADLRSADLRSAGLCDANLHGANLCGADLRGANLHGANLCDANLRSAAGDMKFVKSMQFDTWRIVYTHDRLIIGCQSHPITDWKDWKNKPEWIAKMSSGATEWAAKFLDLVLQIIELSPAAVPVIKEKAE